MLPHGASSKEKAIFAIDPGFSEPGILAFARKMICEFSRKAREEECHGRIKEKNNRMRRSH
jgi:hypothetical protein